MTRLRSLKNSVRTLFVGPLGPAVVLQLDLPIGLFNSGGSEALARSEWYIYVSTPCPVSLPY